MSWYTDIKDWIANNIRTNHQREITGAKMNTVLNNIVDEVENKVDKVEGKGLSTNDYTNTDKAKVASALQTETDPTVPSWAKAQTKPTYTASEVGAIPAADKGANGGVATLDNAGKVPQSQLPSYVDDVLEYANLASFPSTGESGKIYVALDTNKTYRWSGSAYVEISQSLTLGETSSTAFPGDRGKAIEDKIPSNASSSNKLATEAEAVPAGGTTGQVLAKKSNTDNDLEWVNQSGGDGVLEMVIPDAGDYTRTEFEAAAEITTQDFIDAVNGEYKWVNKVFPSDYFGGDVRILPIMTSKSSFAPSTNHYYLYIIDKDCIWTIHHISTTSPLPLGSAVYTISSRTTEIPDISTDISTDATSDTKTTSPKAVKTFVENKGYGTYSKPSTGIPKTDLASGVQDSLDEIDGKLTAPDTAGTSGQVLTSDGQGGQSWQTPQSGVSSYNDLPDKPQINSVTLSGNKTLSQLGIQSELTFDNTPTANSNNPVKSGGVKTALDAKQDTLVSGTSIKTVNNTSLLGSGNIQINDGVGFQTITTQQDGTMVITLTNGDTITVDLNHTHPNYYKKTAETSQPSGGMLPDVIYTLGTLTGATTFTFAAAVSGNLNHYYFTFTSGSTAVVPTWPASITSWDGNCVDSTTGLPVIAASKTYEVSVIDGNAIIKEW